MQTLVDLLGSAAERYGDRPALTAQAGLRLRTWSYRRLWGVTNGLARHFRETYQLAPGTPVVVWAPNSPELVAALFGALAARLVVVPIDPSATPDFVERVANLTRARLIVASPTTPPGIGVQSVGLAELPLDERHPLPDAPMADDVAEVVFTSGTTGTPKGVVLLHRNITANVQATRGLAPDRPLRLISLLPLSHMFEQTVGLYVPLMLGSTIHYPSSRRAPVILKAIRRNRINVMIVVPQVLDLMMREIEREVARRDQWRWWQAAHRIAPGLPLRARRTLFRAVHRSLGGQLRYVMCGGARLPVHLAASWERIGVRVVEGYGATECSPVVAANTYWNRRHGSVGRPLRGVEVDLSAEGELLVRGPNVFARYWDSPEPTARAVDEHGWFHTGDLATMDTQGYLRITGRRSDRIVLASGLNVYPQDVERELRKEPEIEDCVAISVPNTTGGAPVHAVVIPAGDEEGRPVKRVATEEAMRRAAARLAPHQRPTGLTIWPQPDFPRTNLLKVRRFAIQEAVQAGAATPAPARAGDGSAEDDLLERLRHLLASVTRMAPDRIHPTSDLTLDLGVDSLGVLELAAALEDEFGVVVDDGELADLARVDDLRDLIDRAEHPVAETPPPTWPQAPWASWLRDGLQRVLLFPVHRLVARPFVVEGRDAVEGISGPVLIVANHCSHLDTPSILRALPWRIRRRSAVAAAADYFYRSRPIGSLATLILGTFPFSREGAVRSSLERCGQFADDGWSILIYPEGTRSPSGAMAPFRSGIGLLATQMSVPIVPIGVTGTHRAWPKGQRLPRPGAVTVRIGAPVTVRPGADPAEPVERLERAVAALT